MYVWIFFINPNIKLFPPSTHIVRHFIFALLAILHRESK